MIFPTKGFLTLPKDWQTISEIRRKMIYRQGNIKDLQALKKLAIVAWMPYKDVLKAKHWQQLYRTLTNDITYLRLIEQSYCFVCESTNKEIIGMAFLVSSGNPTDIYDEKWSYIRFVSVHPAFGRKGIGRKLTKKCIDRAKKQHEKIIALHTSEIMNSARKLYESLDFRVLQEIEPRLGKRYWLYTLDLVWEG